MNGSTRAAPIRLGALCWNQYTDWPSLLEAGIRADRLGYDSLWTWDQVPSNTERSSAATERDMPSTAGTCWGHRLLDGLATHTNATVEAPRML